MHGNDRHDGHGQQRDVSVSRHQLSALERPDVRGDDAVDTDSERSDGARTGRQRNATGGSRTIEQQAHVAEKDRGNEGETGAVRDLGA